MDLYGHFNVCALILGENWVNGKRFHQIFRIHGTVSFLAEAAAYIHMDSWLTLVALSECTTDSG